MLDVELYVKRARQSTNTIKINGLTWIATDSDESQTGGRCGTEMLIGLALLCAKGVIATYANPKLGKRRGFATDLRGEIFGGENCSVGVLYERKCVSERVGREETVGEIWACAIIWVFALVALASLLSSLLPGRRTWTACYFPTRPITAHCSQ